MDDGIWFEEKSVIVFDKEDRQIIDTMRCSNAMYKLKKRYPILLHPNLVIFKIPKRMYLKQLEIYINEKVLG
jgi:hypothetical protein